MNAERDINENTSSKASFEYCDVTNENNFKKAIENCIKRFGAFDIFINNVNPKDKKNSKKKKKTKKNFKKIQN